MKAIHLRARDGGDGDFGGRSNEGGATFITNPYPTPNLTPNLTPSANQNLMLVLEIYSKSGRRSSLHRTNARDLLFHIHAKSNGSSEGANSEDKSSRNSNNNNNNNNNNSSSSKSSKSSSNSNSNSNSLNSGLPESASSKSASSHHQIPSHKPDITPIADSFNDNITSYYGNGSPPVGDQVAAPLRLRDLRHLDFQFNSYCKPSVSIRRNVVLIALDPIRACVLSDRLILIVPDGADSLLQILENNMEQWKSERDSFRDKTNHKYANSGDINCRNDNVNRSGDQGDKARRRDYESSGGRVSLGREDKEDGGEENIGRKDDRGGEDVGEGEDRGEGGLHSKSGSFDGSDGFYDDNDRDVTASFEIQAYEALFVTINAIQRQYQTSIKNELQALLKFMKNGYLLPVEKQEAMREIKNSVNSLLATVEEHRECLQELMADDEAMSLMNLTLLRSNPDLYTSPFSAKLLATHENIEFMLEPYLLDFNNSESSLASMKIQLQSAEDSISLRLDTARNQLLIANTNIAILAFSIAIGSYIASIFGMNLDNTNTIQETKGLFAGVFSSTVVIVVTVYIVTVAYFRHSGVLPVNVTEKI